MRVLGLDPGYAIVGYGVLDGEGPRFKPVTYGAITTLAHTAFEDRLAEIHADMNELLTTFAPDAMAIETLFFTTNQKTAMAVAQARGVILLCAKLKGIPIFEYTPLQVKQSVAGYGRATKKQMQEMTRRLLKLKDIPKPDDAADALAMAICHMHSASSRQFGLGESRRKSMGYY